MRVDLSLQRLHLILLLRNPAFINLIHQGIQPLHHPGKALDQMADLIPGLLLNHYLKILPLNLVNVLNQPDQRLHHTFSQ